MNLSSIRIGDVPGGETRVTPLPHRPASLRSASVVFTPATPPAWAQHSPSALSRLWLQQKYAQPGECTVEDVQRRVAWALAQAEAPGVRHDWARRFLQAQAGGLLPGGRIMAGAGVEPSAWAAGPNGSASAGAVPASFAAPTLLNCFVAPALPLADLTRRLRTTLQAGGGVGLDFSPLQRGVLQAIDRCDAVAAELEHPRRDASHTPRRRAALMAVLRVDHPDIDAFITAAARWPRTTCSVAVDDGFMHRLADPLAHVERARWAALARAACETGEPGLLFPDAMRRDDNLGDQEHLSATNPCGEQPLPPNGACALASIDLTRMVRQPCTPQAHMAWGAVAALVHTGVRLLDNALLLTHWPLAQQAREGGRHRRVGLGVTGLADALALLGLRYGSPEACAWVSRLARFISHTAYRASVRLARERGPYPAFDADQVLQPPHFASRLPSDLRTAIRRHGLRHSHLLAWAPAASISMALADTVSTGIEPLPGPQWMRRWRDPEGQPCEACVQSHAWRVHGALHGLRPPPSSFVSEADVSPHQQLAMVAAAAPHVDGGISKTVSMPPHSTPAQVADVLHTAWRLGLKGVTVYRRGSRRGVVTPTGNGRADGGIRGPSP